MVNHLLSSKVLTTKSSQADGSYWNSVVWQQGRGDQGSEQASLSPNPKTEDAPGLPVEAYLSAHDSTIMCIMSPRVPGMIYIDWCASYVPRIKMVPSFPRGKTAKSLAMPFPPAQNFWHILLRKQSQKNPCLDDQTFSKFPSAISFFLAAHFQCDPSIVPTGGLCALLKSCWDRFVPGLRKEGRSNRYAFVCG